jgi:hypothetical protein
MILPVERYLGGVSRVEVEVIEERGKKLLIKTWDGYKILVYNGKYYSVDDWGKEIPENWRKHE